MLFNILRGQSGSEIIISLFAMVFVVFCTLPIHEYAHALVATKLGDQTARLSGRLTINPLAHLDIIGSLMILFVGFGYAKPVPVNPRNFKNPKVGMALTAIAGPIANIIMAIIFILLKDIVMLVPVKSQFPYVMLSAVYTFLYFAAYINIGLAVFNLLPIPPLDGSRILQLLIPDKYYFKFAQYERYIVIVVFVLIIVGVLDKPLAFLRDGLFEVLEFLIGLPFPKG
jgi:Zn-dependent protease